MMHCGQCGADSHTTEEHLASVPHAEPVISRHYTMTSEPDRGRLATKCDLDSCQEQIGGRHFTVDGVTDMLFHSRQCAFDFYKNAKEA